MNPPIIYELSWSDHDEYVPYLFWHPAGPLATAEWVAYCDGLAAEATRRAAVEARVACDGTGTWVDISDVVRAMIPLVEAGGFVRIQTVRRDYPGSFGRVSGRSMPAEVVGLMEAHNEWVQEGLDEEIRRAGP